MLKNFSEQCDIPAYDICIVGSGPVGIALALALEKHGLKVLLLESGQAAGDPFSATLTMGHVVDHSRHAETAVAMRRALGGTSGWWGGRCVPYDDVDFADRPYVTKAHWPISHDAVRAKYAEAASFFNIGPAEFCRPDPVWKVLDGDVRADTLERWTPQIDSSIVHHDELVNSKNICVLLGATVVDINLDQGLQHVASLTIAGEHRRQTISPEKTVLTCGGLETTRLLLVAQQKAPDAFGGMHGVLGRYYTGHISGKIADIVLKDPANANAHDFFLDNGAYVRRRFSITQARQIREKLLNTVFWLDNPPFHAADHGIGILSAVWFILAIPFLGRLVVSEGIRVSHVGPRPYLWGRHLWNVLRSPLSVVQEAFKILNGRFLAKPPKPGFLLRSRGGRYALHYHGEEYPKADSRVTLLDTRDALDMPYLKIDLKFSEDDAKSVLRSHEVLDEALRASGLAHLEYYEKDPSARMRSVMDQATDGFHQCGTVRMSDNPEDGVVDENCQVHGVDNLFVATSGVFPTSGQANSTFVAVAMALRLADYLAEGAKCK